MASQSIHLNSKFCDRTVGFNARNKDLLGLAFLCRICSLILRDPVQLLCGHRQCKSCVESIDGEVVKCPECKKESLKREVLLDRGFKNDMQTLAITCSLCDWNGLLKEYETHLQQVHPNRTCEYCNKKFGSTNSPDLHKASKCDEITVSCALKEFGCSEPVLRVAMPTHYMTEQHQNAIMTFVRRFIFQLASDKHRGNSGMGMSMDVDIMPHSTTLMIPHDNNNKSAQLQEICEIIDILAGGIETLNEDIQRLSTESLHIQNTTDGLTKNFTTLQLSVQEQNIFLDGIKPNQEILHQDVASLKQKVEDMQYISYDGTLIWKITAVKEKMIDAQSERQTSIYSPPFYSSPIGYKMRARLYLNGDGNARRTHLSLFFVLMRSINGDVQFSVGKQSETIRQQFWATIYKECLMCKSQNIAFHLWRCRCSFNGDDKQFDTSIKLTY
ncbi:unnamed protein product [Rotaria sordida]|uniref:RING-type domain-containing protein n=1 Tax=Rotaria sordida TaxID=392033 RepID=A0A814WYN6_9BILA|nr:unnamed protein product [Rotaria sordida]CAF1199429.1 unnamed protein product [Rotaria sordida]CAF1204427.1 unnamed protein product [Rotaria sordida]